jgi:hypothetical protein
MPGLRQAQSSRYHHRIPPGQTHLRPSLMLTRFSGRCKARSTIAARSLSSSNLVTYSRRPIEPLYAILRIVSSYLLVLIAFVV